MTPAEREAQEVVAGGWFRGHVPAPQDGDRDEFDQLVAAYIAGHLVGWKERGRADDDTVSDLWCEVCSCGDLLADPEDHLPGCPVVTVIACAEAIRRVREEGA